MLNLLRCDLARKVRTDAGNQCSGDYDPGLKDEGRSWRRDAIRGDGLPVHGAIEESRVPVLCRGLSAEAETGKAGHGCPCQRSRAWAGLEKHVAQARGFFLGAAAFFLWMDDGRRHDGRRDRLSSVLRVENGPAKVAGQRGAEHRAGIVTRQAGQPVRRGPVLGGIEFSASRSRIAGLERVDQRAADAGQGDTTAPTPASILRDRRVTRGGSVRSRMGAAVSVMVLSVMRGSLRSRWRAELWRPAPG
ncbi:hypothetical protein P7L74_22550 [Tistrella mobilis]